jgi:hypothetical protein
MSALIRSVADFVTHGESISDERKVPGRKASDLVDLYDQSSEPASCLRGPCSSENFPAG